MSALDVAKRARAIIGAARLTPFVRPGHYYSPLTNSADAERAIRWGSDTEMPVGVTMDLDEMATLAGELAPMWSQISQRDRYRNDEMFGLADAAVYHSMLRRFRPRRVIEVGSGYSTAVALDTIEAHGLATELTCIEPNPERLRSLIRPEDDVQLHQQFVQDIPLVTFDRLCAGDFLFLDSTHVVKAGSDVVWTMLRVLPRLAAGVLVHIHDIFWPLEYKSSWLSSRRDWNEIYLLHAFLSGNPQWRVLFFNDQVWQSRPDLIAANVPEAVGQRPGGIWLEKVA